MANVWRKDRLYNVIRTYIRPIIRSGFGKIEIKGLENIPHDGMIMLAPNHCVGLMDPLMILLFKKNRIAFGSRSDIFIPGAITKILTFLRVLPIARERNGASEVAKNLQTYDIIVELLQNDSWFTLYAEGTHNPERGLLPIKKGIFRIAKMAYDKTGKKVYVVPVSVDYEYFFTQAGRVHMTVQQPMEIGSFFEERKDMQVEAKTYRELCDWLSTSIKSGLGYDWQADREEESPLCKTLKIIGGIIGLPLFIACAIASLPIWGVSMLIMHNMEDKAWTHTVYAVLKFFFPIFIPFEWVFSRMKNFYVRILGGYSRLR